MVLRKPDPRIVGGVYRSGYWGLTYEVLAHDGVWITVKWEDGREGTHATAWDEARDSVISVPTLV